MSLIKSKQIADSSIKLPVRAVTTAALPSNTYNNGLSGVGATLTGTALSPLPPIDGVPLNVGDRLLVMNEAAAANNGIYSVTKLGSGSSAYVLTRTDDFARPTSVFAGACVYSTNDGLSNGGKIFQVSTVGIIIVGTTGITFSVDNSQAVPVTVDKNIAVVTASSYATPNSPTGVTISKTPYGTSYVDVRVNGATQNVGNAVKTTYCYFSGDGGATARAFGAIVSGDQLIWNAPIAQYNLTTSDLISLYYIN